MLAVAHDPPRGVVPDGPRVGLGARRVEDVEGLAGAPEGLVGGVAAGGDGLGTEGLDGPGGRHLRGDHRTQVELHRQGVHHLQRAAARPDCRHGAAVAPTNRPVLGADEAIRGGELRCAPGHPVHCPPAAAVHGEGHPRPRGTNPPPGRRSGAATGGDRQHDRVDAGLGHAQARRCPHHEITAGVRGEQDPHQRVGHLRQHGPRVVEGQDLRVLHSGGRGLVGAPLAHTPPVAPARTLHPEHPVGRHRVHLRLGRRHRRDQAQGRRREAGSHDEGTGLRAQGRKTHSRIIDHEEGEPK